MRELPGVADSKLLSWKKREAIFEQVERRAWAGDLFYTVQFSSHVYIDRFGITRAVRRAAWAGVRALATPEQGTVLLDGLLRAPKEYMQRTITGGDRRVPVIGLASILAKVMRDRLMDDLSADYPQYGFESHKGYATPEHRKALRLYGLTDIHRRKFCEVFS
jgi:ribonuclease HII